MRSLKDYLEYRYSVLIDNWKDITVDEFFILVSKIFIITGFLLFIIDPVKQFNHGYWQFGYWIDLPYLADSLFYLSLGVIYMFTGRIVKRFFR